MLRNPEAISLAPICNGINMLEKVPDSPPPEKEPEDDDPNGPNKFDQLMKAACSIKTA